MLPSAVGSGGSDSSPAALFAAVHGLLTSADAHLGDRLSALVVAGTHVPPTHTALQQYLRQEEGEQVPVCGRVFRQVRAGASVRAGCS